MKTLWEMLATAVVQDASAASAAWLTQAMSSARGAHGSSPPTSGQRALLSAFASAGRRLTDRPLTLSSEHASLLPHQPRQWYAADAGRVALLIATTEGLSGESAAELAENLYYRGSLGEKKAVLLALPLLPDCEKLIALAVDACRTNTIEVFSALACENPFPARTFDDSAFNQLVLKTIFLELEVRRIAGLDARITSELIRQVSDFQAERKAAGRSVPDGVPWIISKRFS